MDWGVVLLKQKLTGNTADMYGDNEDLLGRWFKMHPERRQDIFLATKFGNKRGPDGQPAIDSSPEYAAAACAKSLARLGLPSVDLYYCHRLDRRTPIEKTVRAMAQLKEEGKCKYLGLSECSAESLRRAHKVHPISAVQMEYSPFALDIESAQYQLLQTCRELGVAVVAYSPIGRGMLSGKFRSPDDFDEEGDARKFWPRFSRENFPKNLKLVDRIADLAAKRSVPTTPAQLTLAWVLAQGDDIFAIPGTTSQERLQENIDSLRVDLSAAEEQAIRDACSEVEVVGARYPEAFANTLFADTPPLDE